MRVMEDMDGGLEKKKKKKKKEDFDLLKQCIRNRCFRF
jgi:hypothetical protein